MTWALCFNCGATKFGAICPCPECSVASTGDMNLDIAFSDHRMSVDSLKAFGAVVRAIRAVCLDEQLRFWSFLRVVSLRHSEILSVRLAPEQARSCDEVLSRADPPVVVVHESIVAYRVKEAGRRIDGASSEDASQWPPTDY